MISDTPDVRDHLVQEEVSSASNIQRVIIRRLAKDPVIGPRLADAVKKKADALIFLDASNAIADFIRHKFRVRPTKLSRFVFEDGPITDEELKGGILFYGRGRCAACHNGPYFSDFQFHAVAFPQVGFGKNGFGNDEGRFNVTLDPGDRFLFRTPPLYNVSKTSPYSHSGSLTRLDDAIVAHFDPLRFVDLKKAGLNRRSDLFRRMGVAGRETIPTALTDKEVRQLVTFLSMLDYEPD